MIYLSYAAIAVFIIGFLYRIWGYATTPAPLKIPTTPAPTTAAGVGVRMASEVLFFKSLFKGNKWIWLGGVMLHIAFLLVILRHLRYFLEPIPEVLIYIQEIGIYAGIFLAFPVLYLAFRRFAVDRVRYISAFSDFFILFLLLAIVATGVGLKYFNRVDVLQVKLFIIGLFTFSPQDFPDSSLFRLHFIMILSLLVYFPFSKLMHAGGIFFSPALNQIDNSRDKRHIS